MGGCWRSKSERYLFASLSSWVDGEPIAAIGSLGEDKVAVGRENSSLPWAFRILPTPAFFLPSDSSLGILLAPLSLATEMLAFHISFPLFPTQWMISSVPKILVPTVC